MGDLNQGLISLPLTYLVTGTGFEEDNFSTDWCEVGGDGFEMIQVHYIYCVLHSYYYHISSTFQIIRL